MTGVLDPDLTLTQRPLERRPAEGLQEQVANIEQQIAAIGAMHRTRFDQAEIGGKHAVLGHVFDIAEKIAERWMRLLYDRNGTCIPRLTDQHIDFDRWNGCPA